MTRTWEEKKHPRGHGGKFASSGTKEWAKKTADRLESAATASGSSHDVPKPSGKKLDLAGSKKFIDAHYGEWKSGLNTNQDKAIRFYQSPGFALMNGQLRGLRKDQIQASVSFNDNDLARAAKASKDLKGAIKKAPPLTEPVTVYRGFSAEQFGDLKPGQTFADKGFSSTSLTDDVASVGAAKKQATAEIHLPAGTKAAAGSAKELILPPGSKFKVVGVSKRKGVPHYILELVL